MSAFDSGSELRNSSAESAPRENIRLSHVMAATARWAAGSPGSASTARRNVASASS